MSPFLRLSSRIRTPLSTAPFGRSAFNLTTQRSYVHGSPKIYEQANQHGVDENCERDNTPNHPIPSNKAHPTLRDGRQSNLADMEGKPEKLPEDVKKHNEEMENRYDRPYNHIADAGTVEKAFELPDEVKEHNEEVKHRYDKPYNTSEAQSEKTPGKK